MTKKVTVTNADESSYAVVVQVWDKGRTTSGAGIDDEVRTEPDKLAETVELPNPGDTQDFGITSTRYLVIKEG